MREIKFRAWDNIEWVMYDNHSVCLQIDGTVSFLNRSGEWEKDDDGSLISLMQFTGLKDKNGTEIYEGDILQVNDREVDWEETLSGIYSVKWGNEYPAWTLSPEMEDLEYNSLQHACLVASCEVIGNIYETPHLLNPSPEPLNKEP